MELFSARSAVLTLGSEFKFPGAALFSPVVVLCSPPVLLNSPRKRDFFTICKYNGRKRKSPGKSVEEKHKEFLIRKEELLRKSRGQVTDVESSKQEGVDAESLTALVLANGDGAMSVSTLPRLDEGYYPVANASSMDRLRPSSTATQRLDKDSLSNRFSEFLAQKAAQESVKESAASLRKEGIEAGPVQNKTGALRSSIEHTITRKIDKTQAARSAILDDSPESSEEEDNEEWIEVGDGDVGEDEEEEEAEYWEGDLPPMTTEEEDELLIEAERELAELEKLGDAGKDPELDLVTSETLVDSERAEMERKLAELKISVQQMEEQLAGDNKPTGNSAGITKILGNFDGRNGESKLDEEDEENMDVDDEGELDDEEFGVPVGKEEHSCGSDEIRIESKRVDLHYRHRHRQDYWEGDDEEVEEVKEDRGVPAVMRCFDRAKVYVKAGDGGNGVVAFRREKFVPFGGPYGGNGGRGGQVYFEADSSMNSLLPFRKAVHFRAGRGSHGGGKRKEGAVGTDCCVKVPPGTVIKEAGPDGKILLELIKPGQREMLLPGGAGGRGNAAFKTGRNNAPQLAEFGEAGVEMWVQLELKLVADVGIVGVPNAGKSTLLSAISAAKPEIASYPFTTLLPNLGVVALDYDATMVVADLPGLLEGAHTGTGLGHEFLRHTERCRVLVHVVDGMSLQPAEEYEAVRLELQLFNPILSEKPFVVAFNKMDIPEAAERWESFQQSLRSKGIEPFCMSAATQQGSPEVISAAYALLKEQKRSDIDCTEEETKAMEVGEMVRRQRSAPIEKFTVEEDKHTRTWQVTGAGLERFTQMTNWEYFEAVRRFQRVLSASGVNKTLRERGIREGDTVIVAQMEFNWMDSEDMSALAEWKRGSRGSKVWPH